MQYDDEHQHDRGLRKLSVESCVIFEKLDDAKNFPQPEYYSTSTWNIVKYFILSVWILIW